MLVYDVARSGRFQAPANPRHPCIGSRTLPLSFQGTCRLGWYGAWVCGMGATPQPCGVGRRPVGNNQTHRFGVSWLRTPQPFRLSGSLEEHSHLSAPGGVGGLPLIDWKLPLVPCPCPGPSTLHPRRQSRWGPGTPPIDRGNHPVRTTPDRTYTPHLVPRTAGTASR